MNFQIKYHSHIFLDPQTKHKRVTFGPYNYHNQNKNGIKLYNSNNCFQKLLLILRKIFANDLLSFTDVQNKKLIVNKNELREWSYKQTGFRPKTNKGLIEAINRIGLKLTNPAKSSSKIASQKVQAKQLPKRVSTLPKTAPKQHPKEVIALPKAAPKQQPKKVIALPKAAPKQQPPEAKQNNPKIDEKSTAPLIKKAVFPVGSSPRAPFPKSSKDSETRANQIEHIIQSRPIVLSPFTPVEDKKSGDSKTTPLQRQSQTRGPNKLPLTPVVNQPTRVMEQRPLNLEELSPEQGRDDTPKRLFRELTADTPEQIRLNRQKRLEQKIAQQAEEKKTHAIAMEYLEKFVAYCYLEDGVTLSNTYERIKADREYFGVLNTPRRLEKKAKKLQATGTPKGQEKAEKKLRKVEEMNKRKEHYFETFPKSFFPYQPSETSPILTQEEMLCEASEEEIPKYGYHGTSEYALDKIKEEGFNTLITSRRRFDCGSGAYFALDFEGAKKYAENGKPSNILKCEINPRRVAVIKNYDTLYLLVDHFMGMAGCFAQENSSELMEKVGGTNDFDLTPIKEHLRNEITRIFFKKLGYDSVLVRNSAWAGASYINILEPSNENIKIATLNE